MALLLFRIPDSMAIPCSVKALTFFEYFKVTCPEDITNCDILSISSLVKEAKRGIRN